MNDSWKEKRILNRLWISFANNNLSNFIPQNEVLLVSYFPNGTLQRKGQVLHLWITSCYTSTHQNTPLLWQREGAVSKSLWIQRADFQTKKPHVQTELREVKASQRWVLKPSFCCRWTHGMQWAAKTEEQLDMIAVLEPREKNTELSLPWVWIYHVFSRGKCNLHTNYRFPLSTSHQTWHKMSPAFRNRLWDTREVVHVLFIIVIPVSSGCSLWISMKVLGFLGFFTPFLNWVDKESVWLCPRVLREFLGSTTTWWQETAGSPLYLFSKDWVSSPEPTAWDQR